MNEKFDFTFSREGKFKLICDQTAKKQIRLSFEYKKNGENKWITPAKKWDIKFAKKRGEKWYFMVSLYKSRQYKDVLPTCKICSCFRKTNN